MASRVVNRWDPRTLLNADAFVAYAAAAESAPEQALDTGSPRPHGGETSSVRLAAPEDALGIVEAKR